MLEESPDVIVAGFGRFGQIAARLLIVNRFRISTLEVSAEQVALVRRFGRRVYYGDATRLDLLRAAGAADAKLLSWPSTTAIRPRCWSKWPRNTSLI